MVAGSPLDNPWASQGLQRVAEFADIPLRMQVDLLRGLQEGTLRPVGGERDIDQLLEEVGQDAQEDENDQEDAEVRDVERQQRFDPGFARRAAQVRGRRRQGQRHDAGGRGPRRQRQG